MSAIAPAMMDGQAATRGEHPPGGRIRARRRVPATTVSNRATAPGHHARARAPGMAGGRLALGIDALKTGFIAMFKRS